jgi:threonylcarbamoyladenosine tRNA methylthiotransferase MtaB
MTSRAFEELKLNTYKERTRAYLKITGRVQPVFSSYCIIPYAGGLYEAENRMI